MLAVYIIAGIVGLILVLALIAPKGFALSRSIVINKPLPEVFQYLKYVKNQDEWSPWKKKDPNMRQQFEGTDGEVGFIAKWQGNKDVGEGEQEILGIIENKRIDSKLRFFKPWKSESDAFMEVQEMPHDQTEVTWGFYGKNPIPFNVFMLFYDMDKAVGKDFDAGLASLKQRLES